MALTCDSCGFHDELSIFPCWTDVDESQKSSLRFGFYSRRRLRFSVYAFSTSERVSPVALVMVENDTSSFFKLRATFNIARSSIVASL